MPGWDDLLQLGSLGVGAAGTGFGVYEMIKARQAQAEQQKKLESLRTGGVSPFMPNQTPEQMQAFLRPYRADLAVAGLDPASGAGRSALADALAKNQQQQYGMGLQGYNAALAALMGQQPQQASGDLGGFGKAMALAMMARAMKQGQQGQAQPGQAMTQNLGMDDGTTPWNRWANPQWANKFNEFPSYEEAPAGGYSDMPRLNYGSRYEPGA
jgi:hypothetical protein